MQLRLECKGLNARGRVVRIAGAEPDQIATCSVIRFADGYVVALDATAADSLAGRVSALSGETLFADSAWAASVLGNGRAMTIEKYSTYVFPAVSKPPDPAIVRQGREEYAVGVDGREVSWAVSSRSNSEAAELWVRTDEGARGNGYAQRVSAAWASEVTGEGRVAFYSHRHDNESSRRLAAKLGVVHLFDVVSFAFDD